MTLFTEPFVRDIKNVNKYNEYVQKVKDKFNLKTIEKKYFNPKKFIQIREFDFYLAYSFSLIKQWINQNEIYTDKYIRTLEKIIKKLHLNKHLNSLEKEYIIHFRSIMFAKKRNLKKLIVDFPLERDIDIEKKFFIFKKIHVLNEENAYYNFDNCSFLKLSNNNKKENIVNNTSIYLTDRRMVIHDNLNFFSFRYDEIDSYKIGILYFEFNYKNNKYFVKTENKYEFFISYERANKLYN
ncbi:hypothetical protein [Malacoplasma iowae]|uniref:Uncharacterized protein n=2 Tax=Malacoplasma iowae TaxID=2116 RepID=A0A084U2M3_MALIO|nr:hypothetical protein [Malacoplasma iowae]EGZ31523.1 hypothetical protein GUU_01582 [Malacoplasma iowae 695]KFB07209.1 hypothetical protein P271_33 [Malacoplasma iowae DK-CPA]QHG89814.1 hypothetical protein EER00_02870 [Malacoplasma iowae 695]WPL35379.1 hypothetical protein QX180_03535 [Malacoplasma iowae]WPL39216.1 hypothetical protein QX181_01635 [Malacoplasma iowae]